MKNIKNKKEKSCKSRKKIKEIIDRFNLPTEETERQVDKAALLASKGISKKYKSIRFG